MVDISIIQKQCCVAMCNEKYIIHFLYGELSTSRIIVMSRVHIGMVVAGGILHES